MRNVRLEVNKNEAEEEVGIAFLKKISVSKNKKTKKKIKCHKRQRKAVEHSRLKESRDLTPNYYCVKIKS